MSRGFGRMQQRILDALRASGEDLPPLCWFTAHALGIGVTASEASSFRRAASSLAARGGGLELRYQVEEGTRSRSGHYRRNRGLAVDGRTGLIQGARRHLVVRDLPTAETLKMAEVVGKSIGESFSKDASPDWARQYQRWFFDLPDGVFHDDAFYGGEVFTQHRASAFTDIMNAFQERERRRQVNNARWDSWIERQRQEKERRDRERRQ